MLTGVQGDLFVLRCSCVGLCLGSTAKAVKRKTAVLLPETTKRKVSCSNDAFLYQGLPASSYFSLPPPTVSTSLHLSLPSNACRCFPSLRFVSSLTCCRCCCLPLTSNSKDRGATDRLRTPRHPAVAAGDGGLRQVALQCHHKPQQG